MSGSIQDYRVELEAYSGPLDLLLYLVKRHEVDLYDIPIAALTEQYLEHLKFLEQIDVDTAGEFLVMAATLLEIKSQMLLPRAGMAQSDDDVTTTDALSEADPRYELVQQLLAYKRYKDAASALEERRESWQARFAYHPARQVAPGEDESGAETMEYDLEDVQVYDLCQAFARILDSIGEKTYHEVVYDDTPIALHAEDIVDRLARDGEGGAMSLQQIFVGRANRSELIGLFLATLELVRQCKVRVLQDKVGGDIRLQLVPEDQQLSVADEQATDWRDPKTGRMQYDWPSEEARQRAERRAELRAKRAASGQFAKMDDEADPVIDVDGDDEDTDSPPDDTMS